MQTFVKRSLVAGAGAVALGFAVLHFANAADLEIPKADFQGYAQDDGQGAPRAPLPRKYQGRPYQEAAQPPQGYYGPPEESYAYEPPPPVYGYAAPALVYAYPAPRYVVGPVFAPPYYVRGPFWRGYGPHFAYGYGRVGYGRFGYGWHR
jgi:hypothetical protein